ncbi:hydrolase [Salmonella bongori]|nr:hydrolase [Salmonella bongori]
MLVAAAQFVVSPVMGNNAETCVLLMSQAAGRGVSLLVLPEGVLARDDIDPDLSVRVAQAVGRRVYDAASCREPP